MKTYELVVPCPFGLEEVLKREIYDLGYEISRVEDGRVSFQGDAEAVCRANIFLRTAERVLIEVGRFRATTFEELFQGIKALPWEDYIPVNGKFWVKKASSIKSKLFSPSDIQSIAKKAMVERMKQYYDVEWFAEDGAPYPVRIFLLKDEVMVTLDIAFRRFPLRPRAIRPCPAATVRGTRPYRRREYPVRGAWVPWRWRR